MQIQAEPKQLLYHQYGCIWLYYSQKPESKDINDRILSVYRELDIELPKATLSNSDQIQAAFSTPQVQKRTKYIKFAIIGGLQSKDSKQTLKQKKQKKKIVSIRYSQCEWESILHQSFSQMRDYTYHLNLKSIFHSIDLQNNNPLLELLTLYACTKDQICERESFIHNYEKIFGKLNLSQNTDQIMQKFLKNQTFRSFLQAKMNRINQLNSQSEIGYIIRILFKFIKDKSKAIYQPNGCFKNKQYKKLIRWDIDNLNYLKKDSIYFINTFQKFRNSQKFQYAQQLHSSSDQKSIFAMIIINTQSQGSNMINNGIYQINNYAYFNCLNYFQFIKATRTDKKNQQCDFCCYQLEFRMITQQYWIKNLSNSKNNDQVKFLRQIFQFLKAKQQNVTFQDVFIYTKDFSKTQLVLTQRVQKNMKVNNQYCEKIGVLPALLSEKKINQVSSLRQTTQSYKIAKGFNKYHYLTIVLQKQIQLLSERKNTPIFNKDSIELNKKKLQLLLIMNQIPQSQQNSYKLLNQIYEDIKQGAGMLSHRRIDQINHSQQPQRGCFSCFFKEKPLSQQQILSKNDCLLQQHLFNDVQNPTFRSKQLRQLKQQLLFLYQSFQKAVVDINRFGNHLKNFTSFYQMFTRDKQLINDIQVLKFSKTKIKEDFFDDDNNIQSFLSKKESEISTLQSEFQHFSRILRNSQKINSLNNSATSLRESRSSLQANKNKNKKISIQLQKKLQEIQKGLSEQNNRQYREASKLYAKNLLISIQVLKEQDYTVNSLKMIKLYRKLANVYVKTGNIIQLEKLTQIQFFQLQHPLTLKAQLHSYLATLTYNKKNFQLSLNQIQKSCQLLQNVVKKMIQKDRKYAQSINNKKIIDLKILSFKVLYSQMRLQNKQYQQHRIQAFLTSIQRFTQQFQEIIGKERFKIYRIELNLLQIMVEEIKIQIEQKKYANESSIANDQLRNNLMGMKLKNISKSLQIKQDIAKIYGKSLKYALIIIDIMIKRHNAHEISKQFNVETLQAKVQQNFQIIQQIFEMQSQGEQRVKYYWILQLSRFFKERENNKRLFQISQSRRLIQACLHQFKKIKLLDRMDTDLQRYYDIIFTLYRKFMKKFLRTFPLRQNILQSKEVNNDSPHIKMETPPQVLEDPRYNHQIIWLFCIISKNYTSDQLQMIRSLQKQKLIRTNIISCVSENSKFFFNSLIRLRSQGKYIVKGVIESSILQLYRKDVSRDHIITKLKKFDQIAIIMKGQNTDNEIHVKSMKSQLGKSLKVIQENGFKQLLHQYEDEMTFQYETKRNTIFFQQEFYHQKITNYHTIIHSCISHTVNQQLLRKDISLDTYKEVVRKFKENNGRVEHFNNQGLIKIINKLFQYKKGYQQHCRQLQRASDQQVERIKQRMLELSQEVINIYTGQNIFYHFLNSSLRILFENPERVEWEYIQPFIYILYHSILIHSSKQQKQPRRQQSNILKVWRIAEMKNEQYIIYANVYSEKNPYIKYMSFLSTSSSFQWIQKELLKRTNGSIGQISKYAIIQIQVDNDGEKKNQMMDNGFVIVPNKAQFEILFNILDVFLVNQVSKVKIDQIASQEDRIFTDLMGKQIIYIKLKLIRNFEHLHENKQISPPIQYFYNFQSQFNKQRCHYQKYGQAHQLRQFRLSNYTLIQTYIDLGLLAKAEEFIKLELQRARNSPVQFMKAIFGDEQNPQNSKNLLHKLISIYMKRGQHRKAEDLFSEYDKQLKEIKKQMRQQADKRVLAQKSYEMKKEMIELFHDQFNIEQYQDKINDIETQINRLDESTAKNRIKKRQQIIYLYLHRSIYHFQNNKIKQSLQFFKQTLEKIKQLCVPSESFDNVKRYCENIIRSLRMLFGKYQSLNHNHFAQDIKAITTSLAEAIERVNKKQKQSYSDTQVNLYCCEAVAESLRLHEQNLLQSQISNIAQNIEIESQASDNIDSEISQHIGLQHYKENIKKINFYLLGKVQSQKQRVAKCSLTNMEEYLNTFQRVAQKLTTYQVQDLKSRGFKQQSIELIRAKQKKARLALSKMNAQQFQNQIETIFTYCRDKQSHKLEQCRALILQAQFGQIRLQNKLMANNYKMQEQDNKAYQKIHMKLNNAREKLKLAYSRDHNKNLLSSIIRRIDDITSKSHQYLAIMMLRVKVTYQQYFQTGNNDSSTSKNRKEQLQKAIRQLDIAIANRQKFFNVLNEEIYLQSIRSQFSMLIIKDPTQFGQSFSKFNEGIKKRQHFRGMNNLQNAIDCIELLEIFDVFHDQSIMQKVPAKESERLYIYVKEGARSSQNNSLFWRFIRCMFTRIVRKSFKNNLDYILAKLEFICKALRQIKRLKIIDQLSIMKMQQTYNKFITYSKQMKSVEQLDSVKAKKAQIEKMIMDIKDKNHRSNEESQDNMSQLPQNSYKDKQQQFSMENSPLNKGKYNDLAQLNQSGQKFIKSAQKYKQQKSNQQLSSVNHSPQTKYKALIDRDISLEEAQL